MAEVASCNKDKMPHRPQIYIILLFTEMFASTCPIVLKCPSQHLSKGTSSLSIPGNALSSEAATSTLFPAVEQKRGSLGFQFTGSRHRLWGNRETDPPSTWESSKLVQFLQPLSLGLSFQFPPYHGWYSQFLYFPPKIFHSFMAKVEKNKTTPFLWIYQLMEPQIALLVRERLLHIGGQAEPIIKQTWLYSYLYRVVSLFCFVWFGLKFKGWTSCLY